MIGQVRAELARYRSRRLVAVLLLLTLVVTVLVAVLAIWHTRAPSGNELETARVRAQIEAQRPDIQNDLKNCLKQPHDYLGGSATEEDCRTKLLPQPESFLTRPQLDLAGTLRGKGPGVAGLVIALLVVAASTFVGSDWSTGSMTTQLLAQPRRLRLWWAKALAVAIASAVVTAVCLAVFWLLLYLVTQLRDLPVSGTTGLDIVQQVLRAVVLAAAGAIGSFALTAAFRSTVATMSLCFAFSMAGELLVALPFEGASRWSMGNNANGWLQKHLMYQSPSGCSRAGDCSPLTYMPHWEAGLFLLVLLLVSISVSVNVFRRTEP